MAKNNLGQNNYQLDIPVAQIGHVHDSAIYRDIICIVNATPSVAKVYTVTVDTAADDTEYALAVNGIEVTIDSGAGATTTTIKDALVAAINGEALLASLVTAASTGAATFTISGDIEGKEYTVSESDANLSAVLTTQAGAPSPVSFGYGVSGPIDELKGQLPAVDPFNTAGVEFKGFTVWSDRHEILDDGTFGYPANAHMDVMRKGRIVLALEGGRTNPNSNDFFLGIGADAGKIADSNLGATWVAIPAGVVSVHRVLCNGEIVVLNVHVD